MTAPAQTLLLGQTISFRGDPFVRAVRDCFDYCRDGAVLIEHGKILAAGEATNVKQVAHDDAVVENFGDAIISAGFIDTHVHYPQTQMIASYGAQLLQWLEKYTFVTEQQFADRTHADRIAEFFLHELLRNGTTTAAVYCSVHPQSVDAFFEQSQQLNTLMIAGKVMMDRNAPAALLDTAESAYAQSRRLIEHWHNSGRQRFCITPRFAGTSSPAQLDVAGTLWKEFPDTYLQTHLSENLAEVAWMRDLFPAHKNYLDIYASHNLLGPRSIYAHCVHIGEDDFGAFHRSGAAIAHCPTSNLFLGSGLFDLTAAKDPRRPVRVGLGTDIGAGTSFSQLQSLNEAYKITQLRGALNNCTETDGLDALRAFYLATRGGAEALYLDDRIGSLTPGNDADLVILDPRATPLMQLRCEYAEDIEDILFMLMMLGDDRAVHATYVAGKCVHRQKSH